MSEPTSGRSGRVGCGVAVVLALGLVVGGGLWLGQRDRAGKTPCELYARTVVRALDHCYSGQTREHGHHIAYCEQHIDPGEACLERIRSVSCEELERGPLAAAGEVCRKQD